MSRSCVVSYQFAVHLSIRPAIFFLHNSALLFYFRQFAEMMQCYIAITLHCCNTTFLQNCNVVLLQGYIVLLLHLCLFTSHYCYIAVLLLYY